MTLYAEARALAALGRTGDAVRRLEEAVTLPPQPLFITGEVMRAIGAELRAHGQEARRMLAAPFASPPADSKPHSYLGPVEVGAPDVLDRQGYLGALAARRGDRPTALHADSALAAWPGTYLLGRLTYWRARIAALLGEPDRAVALLREALQQGRMDPELQGEGDPAPLHDLPAFQELVRPKG